jgi:hypothetical protein
MHSYKGKNTIIPSKNVGEGSIQKLKKLQRTIENECRELWHRKNGTSDFKLTLINVIFFPQKRLGEKYHSKVNAEMDFFQMKLLHFFKL